MDRTVKGTERGREGGEGEMVRGTGGEGERGNEPGERTNLGIACLPSALTLTLAVPTYP
jgi:hypothetical protein